ncbi:TetR/AcrR family transcriptional regulator [Amycolatopsis kentuckyensis]|uniref:TetR/AcrR family transcriptional regulator n=1 Tax=Amycolatopsis kentuckyensis TaxID=218823 RepID=UPI003563496D
MPKVVDHEERRRRIARTLCRIAADEGLEAVSLGQVAAAAGISKGQVQHYFPNKDAMLRYAVRTLRDQVERQVAAADAPLDLRTVLVALLPLDDERRTEALVANAFVWRAFKDDEIAAWFRAGYEQLREALAALVTAEHGLTGVDAAGEADLLLALTAGLADAVLLGHRTGAEAVELIDRQLRRLTGGLTSST